MRRDIEQVCERMSVIACKQERVCEKGVVVPFWRASINPRSNSVFWTFNTEAISAISTSFRFNSTFSPG